MDTSIWNAHLQQSQYGLARASALDTAGLSSISHQAEPDGSNPNQHDFQQNDDGAANRRSSFLSSAFSVLERVIHGDDDDDDANDNEHDAVVRRGAFEDGNAADSVSSSHRKVPESSINRPRWASDDGTRYSSPTHDRTKYPEQPQPIAKLAVILEQ